MPPNHLTAILNARNGRPYHYWRIGTGDGKQPRNRWDLMREGNVVAIGWPELGNLSELDYSQASKDEPARLNRGEIPQYTAGHWACSLAGVCLYRPRARG